MNETIKLVVEGFFGAVVDDVVVGKRNRRCLVFVFSFCNITSDRFCTREGVGGAFFEALIAKMLWCDKCDGRDATRKGAQERSILLEGAGSICHDATLARVNESIEVCQSMFLDKLGVASREEVSNKAPLIFGSTFDVSTLHALTDDVTK